MPDHPNYSQELNLYTRLRIEEKVDFSTMRKELKEKGFTPKDIGWIIRTIENSELKILHAKQKRAKAIGLIIGGILSGFAMLLIGISQLKN